MLLKIECFSDTKKGKIALRKFCEKSGFSYNEEKINQIMEQEENLRKELNRSSKNVLRYPIFCKTMVKLTISYIACCMIYYGILMGSVPG